MNKLIMRTKKVLLVLLVTILVLAIGYSMNAIIFQHRSIQAQAMMDIFRITEGKSYGPSKFASRELAEAFMDEKVESEVVQYEPGPSMLEHAYTVESFGETEVYSFNSIENSKKDKLIYIHGGGNVNEIMEEHIDLALHIGEEIDAEVIIPIFPLVPYVEAEQMYDELLMMYKELSESLSEEKIILMGDSSGGGLSLSLAQQIKSQNLYPTSQIVLLSPWLDISMSNPLILDSLEKKDYMLDAQALALLGDYWKGDLKVNDPIVSPIYGDLSGIGELIIVAGSDEVFIPDIHDLVLNLDRKNIAYRYYEYENMFHAFPVFGLPESKEAIEIIISDLSE